MGPTVEGARSVAYVACTITVAEWVGRGLGQCTGVDAEAGAEMTGGDKKENRLEQEMYMPGSGREEADRGEGWWGEAETVGRGANVDWGLNNKEGER